MKEHPQKTYPTIACCGLDCGLCPRYYTAGSSRCPGCAGPDFYNKHPSCGFITCCVKKKSLEVCAQCDEFPCAKFEPWLDEGVEYDSFLTYKNVKNNMNYIIQNGLEKFIKQQGKRIKLLEAMLKDYDDGRSKSFYCLAATLLSIPAINDSINKANQKIKGDKILADDVKTKAKILKGFLNEFAAQEGVELKLRKKGDRQ